MKRRFGRRRRSGGGGDGDGGGSAIDTSWLARIVEAGLVPVERLEPVSDPDVPAARTLLGAGTDAEGRRILVAFSPRSGGEALLGLLAHWRPARPAPAAGAGEAGAEAGPAPDASAGAPAAGEETTARPARVYVVSRFDAAARRRLALVGDLGVPLEPVEAGRILEGPAVRPEPPPAAAALPPAQVGAGLADPEARELFRRALASLAGLAAKHAGGVRGTEAGVELVLMARRVARLALRDGQVQLESLESRSSATPLTPAGLAEAFDQLEGQLRKRLRDTRVLRGEEGLRARVQPGIAAAAGLRSIVPFPLGGSDEDALDAAGVAEDGRVVVVAVRENLRLESVGAILDAWAALQPSLPALLTDALPPVRLDEPPRLVVAAVSCDAATARVLEGLTLELVRLDVRAGRDGLPDLVPAGSAPASAPAVGGPRERSGRRRGRGRRGPRRQREGRGDGADEERDEDEGGSYAETLTETRADQDDDDSRDDEPRREGRRGPGRDQRRDGGRDERREGGRDDGDEPEGRPRYAQLSSFDLDDGFGLDGEPERGSRPRGRRRRRGRKRRGGDDADEADESERRADDEGDRGDRGADDGGGRDDGEPEAPPVELAPGRAAGDAASDGAGEPPEDEDVTVDEEDLALAEAPEPEDEPEPMRQERPRRAAILAHADRHSLAAALLLAREARQVEGIWVYPQSELMTFFRSVTTDLSDDVTIIVVGFQASPVRDVLQAASLYAGRLEWYDTSDWPPEDLAQFVAALGTDFVDVHPGLDSPMPLVLPRCSRRSRFSDKLVDLAAARFSEHDFQRWGHLWWWRLGEIAGRPGEHKNELQPLLTGRPSDLAAEADRVSEPPLPPEVGWVSGRDFRIVHFGGYAMVLAEAPAELEVSLVGRIARERYEAQLSLARHEGDGLCILGANDAATPRPLAVGAMAEHLGEKLSWVTTLPGADHVARFRIHGLEGAPERLEAVVSEIGMGRSILEG